MLTIVNAPNYAIKELCDRLSCLIKTGEILHFINSCEELIESNKNSLNNIHYNFKRKEDQEFVKKEWERVYNLLELNFKEHLTKTPEYFRDFSIGFVYNKEKVDKLLKDWKENYNLPTSVYKQLNDLSESNYADGKIFDLYIEDINGLVVGKIVEVFEEYKLIKELDAYKEKDLSKSEKKDSSIKLIKFIYDKSKFDQLLSNINDYNINKISKYLEKYEDGKEVLIHFSNMPLKVLNNLRKYFLDFDIKVLSCEIADVQGYDIEFEHGFYPNPNLYEFVSLNKEKNNINKSFKFVYDIAKLEKFKYFVKKEIKEEDKIDKLYNTIIYFINLIEDGRIFSDVNHVAEVEIADDESRNKLIKLLELSSFEIVNDNSSVKLTDEGICVSGKNITIDNCKTFNEVLDRDMNKIYANESKEELHEKEENMQSEDLENNEDLIEINVNLPDNLNTTYSANGRQMYKAKLSEETKSIDNQAIKKILNKIEKDSFKGAFRRENTEFNLKNVNQEIMKQAQIKKILEEQKKLSDIGVDLSQSFINKLQNMQKSDSSYNLEQNLHKDMVQNLKQLDKITVPKGTSSEDLQGIKKNNATTDNGGAFLNNMTLTDSALKDKQNEYILNRQILEKAINISNEIKQEEKDLSMNDMLRKSSIRVASVQSTNLISNLLVSIIDRKFDSDTAKSFGIFLESEAGKSFISIIVGNLLRHVPQLKNHKNSKEFSEEFNVAGMAQLGNYIIDEHILGLLSGLTSVLDSVDKVRVEDVAHQISEEDSLGDEVQELLKTNIK